jgi:tetratricopeptide (TPR) repeat protein
MMGPFGAGTVLGLRAPRLGFVRASLAAKTTRVGQLFQAVLGRLARDSSAPRSWQGMGMFLGHQTRHGEPGQERVYQNFRANIEEIVRVGRKARVKMILSTVASNLKDCPPFASLHSAGLSDNRKIDWDAIYHGGRALDLLSRLPEAADEYSQAAEMDREYAELQFRLAGCHLALTNLDKARQCYELARDFDALAFRADSRINEIIEKMAGDFTGQGVSRLDAVGALSPADSPGIPGQESFFEHVHLNFEGNYRLARALRRWPDSCPQPLRRTANRNGRRRNSAPGAWR